MTSKKTLEYAYLEAFKRLKKKLFVYSFWNMDGIKILQKYKGLSQILTSQV